MSTSGVLPVLYSTGISKIESDGTCSHITWQVITDRGKWTVFELVVPVEYLHAAARQLGAAALLVPDKIGKTAGNG